MMIEPTLSAGISFFISLIMKAGELIHQKSALTDNPVRAQGWAMALVQWMS